MVVRILLLCVALLSLFMSASATYASEPTYGTARYSRAENEYCAYENGSYDCTQATADAQANEQTLLSECYATALVNVCVSSGVYKGHKYGEYMGVSVKGYESVSCPSGEEYDSETQQCVIDTAEPEECLEIGEYYDSSSQQCVPECDHGSLDHYCNQEPLPPDPEEPQCGPDHPDYQGSIGYGGEATLICGDPDNQCPSGSTYGVIGKDGVAIGGCISNEYNPPKCSGTDVLKVDPWGGHSCLPLNKPGESNEPGGTDDPNNGDSDGDGQGDLTGIAKQMQDIKSLLGRGNTNTNNITESLKGMGKRLEDAIGNIPGGGGGSGTGQTEIVGENGEAITWSGSAITMEVQDGLDELNAVQGEYESLVASVRSEMSASFGSFTGAGGLQDNNITLFGQTFNAGLSKFGADLSMIGSIILFAASFAALGIIMGARD